MAKRELVFSILLVSTVILGLFGTSRADFVDDFEDGQIDSDWIISDFGGLNGTEVGGKFFINGSYDAGETAPGTNGWNQYRLIYNESFSGFLDISVTNTITTFTGTEIAVGLGVLENTSVVHDNTTGWVQYYLTPGINCTGYLEGWTNGSFAKIIMDDSDIVFGQAHNHRMIVHENRSVQLILNGETKGWWNVSYPQFYPFIIVAIHIAGTSIEAEFDDFVLITDANPTAVLTPTSTNLDVGELVGFDGSQSTYVVGSMEAYSFDFGDGIFTGWIDDSFTTHSYAAEGSYDARLKVRADNGKESDWASVTICVDCAMPTVESSVYPTQVETLDPVWFDANGSSDADGAIVGYLFDFGDGSTSGWIMDPYTIHSYQDDGRYETRTKVLDDDGHESDWSWIIAMIVDNRQPVALLDVVDTSVDAGETVYFDASDSYDLDGSVEDYYFDFGDGTIHIWGDTNVEPHEYEDVGTYYALLRVRDNDGVESEAAQVRITVTEVVDQEAEDYSWWVVILLLLIILLLVLVVLVLQWKLVTQREGPEEPPRAEGESE